MHSNHLEDIGVIIHAFDNQEDPEAPWRVCSPDSMGCGFLSDRMSACVVYEGKTAAFGGGGAVILNPAHTRVLCIYGGDGGTRGKTCSPPGLSDTCIPGCSTHAYDPAWCDASTRRTGDPWCDGRPWRLSDLGTFMAQDRFNTNYNEVIVDGFYWNEHLPHSIEAIVTSGGLETTAMYEQFLQTYGLTSDAVPLVEFHKDRPNPFTLAAGYAGFRSSSSASSASSGSQVPASGAARSYGSDLSGLGWG